jgi:hypothetical protein
MKYKLNFFLSIQFRHRTPARGFKLDTRAWKPRLQTLSSTFAIDFAKTLQSRIRFKQLNSQMSSFNSNNGLLAKQKNNSLELLEHVTRNDISFIVSKTRLNGKQLNWNVKTSDSSGNTVLHLAILEANREMLGIYVHLIFNLRNPT